VNNENAADVLKKKLDNDKSIKTKIVNQVNGS
jgi:hypothetical protein